MLRSALSLLGFLWLFFDLCPAALACSPHLEDIIESKTSLEDALNPYALDSQDPQVNFAIGKVYLAFSENGQWANLEKAVSHLKKAHKAFPKDPVITMYLGRAIGARALQVGPGLLTRLQWAREGFRYMDKALAAEKDCFLLRLYRGEAQLMAHPILRRQGRLQKDAAFMESFLESAEYATLSKELKARIQLFMGNYLSRKKSQQARGRGCWQKAISLAANSSFAQEAMARLDGTFENLGY